MVISGGSTMKVASENLVLDPVAMSDDRVD